MPGTPVAGAARNPAIPVPALNAGPGERGNH